jgi:MarR family transcriptional regulator, lower aerobic nicotinate degradation pathway regulator
MIAAPNARRAILPFVSTQEPPTIAPLPRPRPPKEFRTSVSFLLKRMGFRLKERSIQAYESTGLSHYDYGVLALLDEEPVETQAMIADALGYDRSHLVGVLDDLEARELIARRRDPADRRRHLVTLTPAGKDAVEHLRAVAKRVDDEFFEPLSAQERKELFALLARLARHHDPCFGE